WIAVATVAAPDEEDPDRALLERFATANSPEDLQAWYQIALHGRRDLPLAPDPASCFTMTLPRLLAFRSAAPATRVRAAGEPARRGPAEAVAAPARSAALQARAAARTAAGLGSREGRSKSRPATPGDAPAPAPGVVAAAGAGAG